MVTVKSKVEKLTATLSVGEKIDILIDDNVVYSYTIKRANSTVSFQLVDETD
jgi:hypothetical protein